jgi:ketosteroid isomerase-like protein
MFRIRTSALLATLALITLLAACGDSPTNDPARWEQELMAADRQFAAEVDAADPADRAAVWAGWFSPAGMQVLPGRIVEGPEAIASLMGPAFTAPGSALTWEPDMVRASPDGRIGWTSGRHESRGEGPEGPTVSEGRYLTLWARQRDGTWKVDLDTGVPDPEE